MNHTKVGVILYQIHYFKDVQSMTEVILQVLSLALDYAVKGLRWERYICSHISEEPLKLGQVIRHSSLDIIWQVSFSHSLPLPRLSLSLSCRLSHSLSHTHTQRHFTIFNGTQSTPVLNVCQLNANEYFGWVRCPSSSSFPFLSGHLDAPLQGFTTSYWEVPSHCIYQ